jgi:nucleotide-binding universal stress UspA family protein
MFKRILLAFDGSAPAKKAFERALEMATCFEAELKVVAVIRPPEIAEDVETEAIIEQGQVHFERQIAALRAGTGDAGVRLQTAIRVGHPAEQIIAAADEWQADLIVTGHRGQGLFERWLLGSVSRLVIAYARCAVLVIR